MALYLGWNREEMQQAGNAFNELSELQSNMPSFTPVNYNPQSHFISPSRTLVSKAIDSDTLYDLPDEHLPVAEVVPSKGRKRGLKQANKARAVSLGAVWEYNDEGDLQGGDIEQQTAPKKRKAASARLSESTKTPLNTLTDVWDVEGNMDGQAQADEQPNSQLTTPPDSSRMGKKATPSTTQPKAKKTKPFKNPVITKPSIDREKKVDDQVSNSRPVSTYRGWTTTEESVKFNANGIAKTTLDKLAAFRYKPSADTAVPSTNFLTDPTSQPQRESAEENESQLEAEVIDQHVAHHDIPELLESSLLQPSNVQTAGAFVDTDVQTSQQLHFPSGNVMILSHSHDGFFADAIWNNRSSSQATPSDLQNISNWEMGQVQPQDSTAIPESQDQQRSQPDMSSHFGQHSLQYSPNLEESVGLAEHVRQPICSFEPTSSEARALQSVADPICISQRDVRVPNRLEAGSVIAPNGSANDFQQERKVDNLEDFGLPHSSEREAPENLFELRAEFEDHHPQTVSLNHPKARNQPGKPLLEVQLERSDIDDAEPTPVNVSKVYELNEFDEGLDDNDLLAIMTDDVVPETQFQLKSSVIVKDQVLPTQQHVSPSPTSAQRASVAENRVETGPEAGSAEQISEDDRLQTLRYQCSQPEYNYPALRTAWPDEEYPEEANEVVCPDSDDEFPMDEGDEEVFRMPDLMTTGVIERFQAPASLQYDFGDDEGKVYDSSLQFSTPKQTSTGSPTNGPSGLHANKLTTSSSPTHHPDPELLPLGEEEDWGFIRSRAVEATESLALSAKHSAPQRLTTHEMDEHDGLSISSFSARSRPESATSPESAKTEAMSIEWMLDDSHEYEPLLPFARPDFPALVRDRSPILGLSAQTFLRVCFRIGEMLKEGVRCESMKQDAVIELFARVTSSSREPGTTRQQFQFADLWHDRPPFPIGILLNYKMTCLAESESRVLVGVDEGTIVRCLGRLKRDRTSDMGWSLEIINIRTTDWEEIRWTKRIVSADLIKSEK